MEEDVKTTEIDQATQPIAFAQQTRADRLREASSAPDFSIPEIRPVDDFFSESVMTMDNETLKDMMRETGIYSSTSEQTATAISNAFIGMNQLADETKIAYGNLVNYLTGSKIGDELAQIAYESIAQRYSEMANAEEAVGGIRSNLAQLAGGATSFVQLALEGVATAGLLPLAHIGVQEFGQGTYNDMKAYADEHEGSLKGYEPKGFNLAANTANSLLQVGIERWLGVGSPRFLQGASKGFWVEGLSGALQEGVQGALSDLNEAIKGNQDVSILLDNAEDYLRDAIVGGILQGSLGAVTHHQNYARSVDFTSQALAKARGHEQPTAEDQQQAKAIIDAKERQESSVLTKEFKSAFDASTGEGQLQQKIVGALKKAVEAKELDLDTTNETELAQRLEGIATQETLNAMDFAKEQNRSIADMELNNIVYKDGAIWLEGVTPELGDKAGSYARVLAERQSGLAELKTRIDANSRELQQLKADLAEAKAQKQESRAQVLQARIDKQNALAEKNRLQAQKLEAQTAKLEKQIAKQTEQVKVAEPVKTEKVSAEAKPVEAPAVEKPVDKEPVKMAEIKTKKTKPVAERKSLKQERANKKKTLTREQVIENMTNGSDRFLKIIIPTEGNSFITANKETLDKIDMFAQADFLQRAVANDKITPDMISEIFDFVINMPQGEFLSNIYYDIMAKPTTPTEVALKAKEKYDNALAPTAEKDFAGKTNIDFANTFLELNVEPIFNDLQRLSDGDNIIKSNAESDKKIKEIATGINWKNVIDSILLKYDIDSDVKNWLYDSNISRQLYSYGEEIKQYRNNLDALIANIAEADYTELPLYDFIDSSDWSTMPKRIQELIDKYDSDLYLLPKTLEELEHKILNKIGADYMDAIEYDTGKADILPDDWFSVKPEQVLLLQGTISGKGDTARGGYDEQLKRIILGEKSDLTTIQHEFAHYWMQNNFKWARSGLASQDWLRRWRDVEEWLGIEPQDRLLSKSASEKFAKAYERYILEGKVAPELQWAFEGFQKAYQDIYSELENEYFDLSEELAPEVVDWFNRNKEQSPKRLLEGDTKKLEKALIVNAGGAVTEEVDGNVVMTEQNKEGDPVVYMGIKESEVPAGDNLLVYADKTTASKLQQSAKKILGDSVEVQQLATLDTQKTLNNFKDWIARDRQGAWNSMMNPDTRPVYRTYLYKAFAEEAMNDVDLAMELANIDMAKSVREMGQAIQALDIRNLSGFDTLEIIRNIEKSKGKLSSEELNKSVESIGLDMIELSQEDIDEIEFDTECKL